MTDTLYTDILLDLYRHPLNKQPLSDFNAHYQENNPLCGDQIELFIKFDADDTVSAIGWTGDGCAISQASASVVTEHVKTKSKMQIEKITSDEVLGMLGLKNLNPSRMRCALLALEAIHNSLIHNS